MRSSAEIREANNGRKVYVLHSYVTGGRTKIACFDLKTGEPLSYYEPEFEYLYPKIIFSRLPADIKRAEDIMKSESHLFQVHNVYPDITPIKGNDTYEFYLQNLVESSSADYMNTILARFPDTFQLLENSKEQSAKSVFSTVIFTEEGFKRVVNRLLELIDHSVPVEEYARVVTELEECKAELKGETK